MAIVSTVGISSGDLFTTTGKDLYEVIEIVSDPQIILRNLRTGSVTQCPIGHSLLEDMYPIIHHPGEGAVAVVPEGIDLRKNKIK